MLKSYLKLAIRNIWKRTITTGINVLSLAVGITSCALVFLYYQHEKSFDKGFDNADRIYRVTTTFGKGDDAKAPTAGLPYAKYLKAEIPEVEQVARLDATNGVTIVQVSGNGAATPYAVNCGYWVDPTFFDIFSFHFLQGNRATAFNAPNTIVLSETLAKRLFGSVYPVGKSLKTNGTIYTVTGVFREDILNHIQPDFLASNNSDHVRDKIANATNWVVDDNYYTYIKLKPSYNLQHVLGEITTYTTRHAAAQMKTYNDYLTTSLQALLAIHLNSQGYQDYLAYKQGDIKYLYLLGTIAMFILILGCINYINLSTAQSVSRAREVGVRRVLGAGIGVIRAQVITETVVVSLFALIVAAGLAFLFLPVFNGFTGQSLSFFAPENRSLVWWLLGITLATGFVTSLYPAFYLSSFNTVKVLKGKVTDPQGMFSIRKVLIVSQFVISTCLVFGTLVIYTQMRYMITAKPGFDEDQQLTIDLNSDQAKNNVTTLISQLKANPIFKSVTGASAQLVSGDLNLYAEGKTINDKQSVFLNLTDENYVKTIGLKLVSGTNFIPQAFPNTDMQQDVELNDMARQIILNEEAVSAMKLNPYTAPGKYVSHLHNGVIYKYKIAGVMKNYHYFSLHAPIGPCAIVLANPKRFATIIAKVNGTNMSDAIKYAGKQWKELNPDTPFSFGFLNDVLRWDYIQDQREQQLANTFTIVAIFISCLGLLGLITYSVTQKAREIGIRKVIGASVLNIVMLFSRQYFKLIIIANLIAWPMAWFFMNNWLSNFAYRVNISWWMFLVSLLAGVVVAFATIAFKTVKAAIANPVTSLRND
jgi:putative ABC transport system permease protein